MKGLISVVIPAYNVEPYIEEALVSLLSQTYENFECIIVDDGSTDATLKVIEKVVATDPRFSIVRQSNQGVSVARNNGMQLCRGKYLYFFDSDDRIIPGFFSEAIQDFEKSGSDVLTFNARSFFEENSHKSHFQDDTYVRTVPDGDLDPVEHFLKTEQFKCPVFLHMYRRDFLVSLNLKFKEGFIHEDEAFSLIVAVEARKVSFKPICYFERRVRSDSIMTSKKSFNNTLGYFEAFKEAGYWYGQSSRIAEIKYSEAVKERIAMFYLWALRGALKRGELREFKKIALPHLPLIFRLVRTKNALAILFPLAICRFLST